MGGRKLIAVVYADMVGYSRLIGLDDAGTLRRLRTLRRALIDPAVHEHGGRIVQTGGDSLLVAFDSIDGAVRCAVKVQQQVPVYDGDQQDGRRIRFRVGIDMGDAIPDGTDLHGDAVNIAARLEAASSVGGICVSRPVRDYVHGRLDLAFEPVGELALKNIARPVEAFVLRLDPGATEQPSDDDRGALPIEPAKPRAPLRPALVVGAALLLVPVVAATGWWFAHAPTGISRLPETAPTAESRRSAQPAATQSVMQPNVGLSNAPRLSLVVLPFDNLGGDGVQDYIVDGITEDLTTDLSSVPGFLVIARNSAFTYKGKPVDIKRVGDELGVRYAVEGSVRKVGDTLRVNAQLVSTESGAHIWAERFDMGRDGGYGVDDIVRYIAARLHVQVIETESARGARERPSNPDAADFLLRARAAIRMLPNPQQRSGAVALFERAVELDPSSVTALAGLGSALVDSIGGPEDPTAPAKLRRVETLLARAESLRPDDVTVMLTRLQLLNEWERCPELVPAAQRMMEIYPNHSSPPMFMAVCLVREGRAADAIPKIEQAIRLDPRRHSIYSRYRLMGYALLSLGRLDKSVLWFQRSLAANPSDSAPHRGSLHAAIAAAQALAGRTEEAHLSVVEASRLWPTITVRSYYRPKVTNPVVVEQVSRVRDGLRLAGVRDHADEHADLGVPPDDVLHTNYEAPTPISVPGAWTVRTPDLAALVEQRKPLVLDTNPWGRSITGAVGLRGAGIGGSLSDEFQDRLSRKMQQLTGGDRNVPVVTMGWNAERFQGRNLALRLAALGYTEVYWYRGGTEAWEVAGLPETDLVMQDW